MRLILTVAAALAPGAGVSEAHQTFAPRERLQAEGHDATALTPRADSSSAPLIQPQARRSISLVDGENVLTLRGLVHVDGRRLLDDAALRGAESWQIRRLRPTIEGTLKGIYEFRFTADFSSGETDITHASLGIRLNPWTRITAGKFKMPVGLERSASSQDLRFIEHAFPTSLVPNLGMGVQLGGQVAGGAVDYAMGYFNPDADDGESDSIGDLIAADGDLAARFFVQPFVASGPEALRGLGFGLAGTYARLTGNESTTFLPAHKTPGRQRLFRYRASAADDVPPIHGTFADGERWRLTPQFRFYLRRFALMGEYVKLSQDVTRTTASGAVRSASLEHTAWHMQFAWMLTGENQSPSGFKPVSMFSIDRKTWGAFELVARLHALDIDDATFDGGADSFADPDSAPAKATSWGLGINWYVNDHVKWSLNQDVTRFDGGAIEGDRPRERAVSMRFGLQF